MRNMRRGSNKCYQKSPGILDRAFNVQQDVALGKITGSAFPNWLPPFLFRPDIPVECSLLYGHREVVKG